jgi:DNA-binding NarL/FixJ family response regulator
MIHSSSRTAPHVDSAHELWPALFDLEKGFPDSDNRRGRATRLTQLTRREQQIVNLFLEGWENIDIAKELGIAHRTVKACFNRLYLRFGITSGIKRVKLATFLYRSQLRSQRASANDIHPPVDTTSSLLRGREREGRRSRGQPEPWSSS